MNSRPLTPFLISFALVAAFGFQPARAEADASGANSARTQLLAALAHDLGTHFKAEGDLQLETLRPWILPATAPAADWTVAITEFPAALTSSILLRVRLTAPGQPTRDDTLTCKAQLFRDAWAAQAPIERGANFDPARCELRRIDALRERDAFPTTLSGATEWVFARPIPSGRLVTWRDVARRALVRKGDVIEVAAIDGPLQVTMKALAMQDGGQGETVRVRNLESKREFAAMVVSENRAQVRF